MFRTSQVLALLFVLSLTTALTGCSQNRGIAAKQKAPSKSSEQELRLNVARLHEREGNLGKAEVELKKLLAESPGSTKIQHRLGIVMVRQGKTSEGIQHLLEVAAADTDNVDLLNDLGYAYFNVGDYEAAEGIFREALRIKPNDARATNNLALVIGYQGHTQDAYYLFRRNLSEAEALANIGYIHVQRGELDQALARYSQALNHDPKMKKAADAMVQIHQLQKRAGEASQDVKYAASEQQPASHRETHPIILTEGR